MADSERTTAVNKLIAVCFLVKKRNSPEFMRMFADVLNAAIEASGSDDRVSYPGAWSNELHLESGGKAEEHH